MTPWDDLPVERDFDGALARLADGGMVGATGIVGHLSHASAEEVERWRRTVPSLSTDARRRLVLTLVETAEADIHLDFTRLFESALDDADDEVRAAAIGGLWECEAPRLVPRFVALLQTDPSARVRARAGEALGPFLERAELGELSRERVAGAVSALTDAFEDESEALEVRRRALESLGYCEADGVRALIDAGARAGEAELRAGALRAMGRSADEAWQADVLSALDDDAAELRFEAARAAGELGLGDATPYLERLAAEGDRQIRLEAIWALGEIGGAAARAILERLASRADDEDEADAIDEALATVALGQGDMSYWASPFSSGGGPGRAEDDEDDEDDEELDDGLDDDGDEGYDDDEDFDDEGFGDDWDDDLDEDQD